MKKKSKKSSCKCQECAGLNSGLTALEYCPYLRNFCNLQEEIYQLGLAITQKCKSCQAAYTHVCEESCSLLKWKRILEKSAE